MTNQVGVAMENSIITLNRQGWSNRRIALELGINRKTVDAYVNRHLRVETGPNPPTGSVVETWPNPPAGKWSAKPLSKLSIPDQRNAGTGVVGQAHLSGLER